MTGSVKEMTDKRHDENERRRLLNAADIVFLCLPDAGAIEAVDMIVNPHVRVIDASTAHRVSEGWVYGFPELSAQQRREIAESSRITNPGCHATGFISVTAPHGNTAGGLSGKLLFPDRLLRGRQKDDRRI